MTGLSLCSKSPRLQAATLPQDRREANGALLFSLPAHSALAGFTQQPWAPITQTPAQCSCPVLLPICRSRLKLTLP